jgi:hypothetical protein
MMLSICDARFRRGARLPMTAFDDALRRQPRMQTALRSRANFVGGACPQLPVFPG